MYGNYQQILHQVPMNRRERKRLTLANRLARLAFAQFESLGFAATTMEGIAAQADVAKATLYKYFPTKEALLAHHLEGEVSVAMGPLWRVLEKKSSFAAQLKHLLRVSAQWHAARRQYIPQYLHVQFGSPGATREMFQRLCSTGQQRGDVRTDLAAWQLAGMLQSLCLGALMTWLATPEEAPKLEFDAVLTVALAGLAPPEA